MTGSVNVRNLALKAITDVMENGQYSHICLKKMLDDNKEMSKSERAFLSCLVEGTIERVIEMDYIIERFSKIKIKKMKPLIRNLLRMSVYQLKYMDSVPDSAVINEAVKIVEKRKMNGLKGFVNGVLRNISRNIDTVIYPAKDDTINYLSVRYSMPDWIVEKFIKETNYETTEMMLAAMLSKRKTCVRVNASRASVKKVIDGLCSQGIFVKQSEIYENALYIDNYDSLNKIREFNEGLITVQDLSSMFVCMAAKPEKGMFVIDVCAAPGGKSLHIADKMGDTGLVLARDLTDKKVNLINENISRIKLKNIKAQKWDALIEDEQYFNKADIVICDLPCSGLGIMGNKTDIKYKVSKTAFDELSKLQREILKAAVKYVKPNGTLIYSTCTINKHENIDNAEWIKENLGLTPVSMRDCIPDVINEESLDEGYLQLLPGKYGTDGFFVSKFVKTLKEI